MPELFGYISDTSSNYKDDVYTESQLDDDYDIDDVITESDLALMEFDQYVQEGVGLAIVAGVGIAAALGSLIALIVYICKKKGSKGVKKQAEDTKKAAQQVAKTQGADTPVPNTGNKAAKVGKGIKQKWNTWLSKLKFKESYSYTDSSSYFYQEATSVSGLVDQLDSAVNMLGEGIDEMVDLSCKAITETCTTFEGQGYDAAVKVARKYIVAYDDLKTSFDSKSDKLDMLDAYPNKEDIRDLTVSDIIRLSDMIEKPISKISNGSKKLDKCRRETYKYTSSAAPAYKEFGSYLDKTFVPMIREMGMLLSGFSTEYSAFLKEAEMECKKLIASGTTNNVQNMAFGDVQASIDSTRKKYNLN